MDYFLGIDLGTSSVKVLLVDERGKVLAKSSERYPVYSFHEWAEQEPEEWWKATVKAINELISRTHVSSWQIKGVGISGQTHGVVILDKRFFPLRKAIIWMDRRSISQVEYLKEKFGKRLTQLTGLPISCGFMLPSLLWIRENEPSVWDRIHKVLLPKDYIRLKLTGVVASDVTDAGGTLLLDTTRRRWSKEIIDELGIPYDILPPLYESPQLTGRITSRAAEYTFLKEGTAVFAGGADQVMMAVGAGVVKADMIASSIGTGALLVSSLDHPVLKPHKALHTIPHAVLQKWILMGAILCGGSSLNWLFNQVILGESSSRKLNLSQSLFERISSVPAASRGLLFLPYLDGERTPHLDPLARGAFIGLSLRHSRQDLIRAVMEGVSFALRDCLEEFKELGIRPSSMVTSGGGAKSRLWRKILANVFNLPVFTVNVEEASAYGASMIASVGAGIFSTVEEACQEWVRKEEEVFPEPEKVRIYEEAYQVYRGLYCKLKDDFHVLSRLEATKL